MAAATDNMKIATKVMKQPAVYWAPDELDEFGKPSWETAVEILCRWDDVIEEFIDYNNEQAFSRAQLFVDRDLEVKGVLFKGELTDVTDLDDPKNNTNAWEILQVLKTADFKGTRYLREAYL